jgi:asparagine N-glycosylation enzyme membrane subunit Stt3
MMDEQPLSKEGFKLVALISLVIGLFILIIPSLYFLLKSMSNLIVKSTMPMSNIVNIIGSTILNIIGNNPLWFGAFLFITTAILFGIGYLIKDDNDREFYQLLIYLSWFVIPLIIFLSTLVSALESIIVGSSCLVYISPPFIYIVHKGLKPIIDKFK